MSHPIREQSHSKKELNVFDPLPSELLLRLIDPVFGKAGLKMSSSRGYLRGVLLWLCLITPVVITVELSPVIGERGLFGQSGLARDIGFYANSLFLLVGLLAIVAGRRFVGRLASELVANKIVGPGLLQRFSPEGTSGGFFRLLERITRLGKCQSALWLLGITFQQVHVYWKFLSEGTPRWYIEPAVPDTFFYLLHVGTSQPNMAGLLVFLVVNPITGYLLVVMARLFVVFACFCRALSEDPSLLIHPVHEDRAGGLQPVGRASLFHSLFTFIVGLQLVGLTLSELVTNALYRKGELSYNLKLLMVLGAAYLFLGTLLFFLPVWSMRARMAEAKGRFLQAVNCLYADTCVRLQKMVQDGVVDDEIVKENETLGKLIQNASLMAVWPFDKSTFMRFSGILVTPLSPLIADQLPRVLDWLKSYLLPGVL